MRKYLFYIIPFLFLALVVGFKPTTAYASEHFIGPDSPTENGYRLYVSVECLSYGAWETLLYETVDSTYDAFSWFFDIDASVIDHVNGDNFRIRFYYQYHTFLSSNTYSISNYFEMAYGYEEYYAIFSKINVYYALDEYGNYYAPLYSNVGLSSSYPDFYVDVSPTINTDYICIEFASNIHEQFQTTGREQSYFMIGSGNFPITYSSFVPSYPDNVLPDVNINGLPDFGDYKPSGGLGTFFDTLFAYRYVAIGMLMTLTLGVVSFLLFGERK